LFELARRRDWCLAEARRNLNAGNHAEARRLALCANSLRADAESQRLVAVTSLLCREFAQALQSAHFTRSL
jgi:hypothetical protein